MDKLIFKDNIKKSIIDEFISEFQVDPDSNYHSADCVRALPVDDQLDLFKEKLFSLLKFAYKHDLRIQMCRPKTKCNPYDFTEFTIEVPNEYSNLNVICDDGTLDTDPLIEILFTIEKINPDVFLSIVDEFGDSRVRAGMVEIWISYDIGKWAACGVEPDGGVAVLNKIDKMNPKIVEDDMVLPVDVCHAAENILKELVQAIKKDKAWHTWFILQGIDIEEVFLWNLSC